MNFTKFPLLEGLHAKLSASNYAWINYDDDKFIENYYKQQAKQRGTELHELAEKLIHSGIKLPDEEKTLNMYVNDCIGYGMEPEVVLKATMRAFGTADAIDYNILKRRLRLFDLKTGIGPVSKKQLFIYVAYFCMQYDIHPKDIKEYDLRFYQNNMIEKVEVDAVDIIYIIDKVKHFDSLQANLEKG